MKKHVWIAAMIAFVMASCNEESFIENVVNGPSVFNASFENSSKTRVAVGNDNTLAWSTGDQFVILSDQGAGCYTLSGEGGSTTGTFTGTFPSGNVKGAAFPFVDAATQPSLSGNTLTMTLPAEISFEEGVCDAPMWAGITSNDEESISFKHLVSMLKVDLSGIPATAGQLIVDASAPISGNFTADISKTGDELILAAATGATNSITVEFTASPSTNQQLFLIPIPVGTYDNFALSYANEDGTGKTFLKSWNNLEFERAVPNKAAIAIGNIEADLNSDYAVDGDTYTIKTVAGLFWFADQVNNAGNNFVGKTVTLANDIDLNNVAWTPIGINGSGKLFKGTFDGADKTISKLSVDCIASGKGAGLFGYVPNPAIIKNLNIQDVDIKGQKYAGAIAGQLEENGTSRATIQNCSVNGGTITLVVVDGDNGNHAGGITGYASKNVTIEECSVMNLTITAYKDMGGIAGTATGRVSSGHELNIKDCTVNNVTFVQDLKDGYETAVEKIATVGDIVGRIVNDALQTEGNQASEMKIEVKAYNQTDAQFALDLANTPRSILLAAGEYGTLYLRWNEASELITSSDWAGGGHSYKRLINGLAIEGVEGTKMTSLIAESGTYLGTAHSLSATHANLETIIVIEKMKIKGIEFNTGVDDVAIRFGVQGQHTSIEDLIIEKCVVNGTGTTASKGSELFVSQLENPTTKYGIDMIRKDIKINECVMNNLYQGLNIYYMENLTISGNKFNNIQARDMLFSCSDGDTGLIGTINITNNTSDGAKNRFIRMARLNGELSVTGNIVTNYEGSDPDMVKIDNSRADATIIFSGNTWMGSDDATAKSNNRIKYDK